MTWPRSKAVGLSGSRALDLCVPCLATARSALNSQNATHCRFQPREVFLAVRGVRRTPLDLPVSDALR